MVLNPRQVATVLAALRYWQDENRGPCILPPGADPDDCSHHDHETIDGVGGGHFDEVEPLSVAQIDELCERLNTDEPHAVATGNAFDGLTLYGPFDCHGDAMAYADVLPDTWWIVPLLPPEDSE